jgi:hypothetical protein
MSDEKNSILDDVRAAAAEVAMPADTPIGIEAPEKVVETPEAHAGETAEQAAERARDEKGRFAKQEEGKPRETLKLKEKPLDPTKPADTNGVDAPIAKPAEQAKAADEPIAPPAEWKGAGKVQWNKLPKAVQQEMRETYESVNAARAEFEPLSRAIAPHRDLLIRDAGSVEAGIKELMAHYHLFLTNPVGLIQHIARTRGIDLGAPQGQPAQGIPQQPADLSSHIAQAVQQAIAPIQERFAQTETQQTEQTLSAFAADPKHPYFQDVRVHMGQLLKAGAAKDLDEAYEQATWANPVIRQQLLQAQAEETAKTQAAQAATARKAAAASLTGAPIAGAGAPEGRASKTESARDTVLKVYREQQAGA